jgi:hypothetical protein
LSLDEPIKNLVHALILLILFSMSSPKTTGNGIPFQDSVAEMTGQRVNWNRQIIKDVNPALKRFELI